MKQTATLIKYFLALSICYIPLAQSGTEKPICPTALSIQTTVYQFADFQEKKQGHMDCCTASGFPYWVTGEWSFDAKHSFDTNGIWNLVSSTIYVDSYEEAFKTINQRLIELRSPRGPYQEMGVWYCNYETMTAFLQNNS